MAGVADQWDRTARRYSRRADTTGVAMVAMVACCFASGLAGSVALTVSFGVLAVCLAALHTSAHIIVELARWFREAP